FISYSQHDRFVASALVKALQNAGIDVWFDRENLTPGEVWTRQISGAMERADLIVFLLGARHSSRFETEVAFAIRLARENGTRLIPVFLDSAGDGLSYGLAAFTGIRLSERSSEAVAELAAKIAAVLPRPPEIDRPLLHLEVVTRFFEAAGRSV